MHPPQKTGRKKTKTRQNDFHPVDSDREQKDCVFVCLSFYLCVCVSLHKIAYVSTLMCVCEPTSPVSHDSEMDAKSLFVLCGTLRE